MLSIVTCLKGEFGFSITDMSKLQASELMTGSAFSTEEMEQLFFAQMYAAINGESR